MHSRRRAATLAPPATPGPSPLVEGIAVGAAIGQGPVVALDAPVDLDRFPPGGVPAVVGTGDGTRLPRDGAAVTVSCAEGERGRVYEGSLAYEETETDLADLPATRTHVMLNLADPSAAFRWWRLPADGVGRSVPSRPGPSTWGMPGPKNRRQTFLATVVIREGHPRRGGAPAGAFGGPVPAVADLSRRTAAGRRHPRRRPRCRKAA
ncbi:MULTISPECIES: hypothetical protein [unclassified Streptomyces]|uniref:hypothetical protein n=1 Tax=unclassified Streptomyces TaxID=2593676 RepID=UPI0006FFC8E5|nr:MULTISPECIES: hypothetical protein [unclassified Streptomyces]KQX51400.1 hypothetical protein ASD33_33545 [Streptomyces sp. Root1304]KRA85567.1 hypothetical protein ASE09_33585 [Streptomyces sp. Root66D1]